MRMVVVRRAPGVTEVEGVQNYVILSVVVVGAVVEVFRPRIAPQHTETAAEPFVDRRLERIVELPERRTHRVNVRVFGPGPALVDGRLVLGEGPRIIVDRRILVVADHQVRGLGSYVAYPQNPLVGELPFHRKVPVL